MEEKHPIDGVGTYVAIYVLLLALLVTTVGVSRLSLGPWNVVVAILIAVIKALFVILFFMHVRRSSRITWVFAGAAFLWLSLLIGLTLGEYWYRPYPSYPQSTAQMGNAAVDR